MIRPQHEGANAFPAKGSVASSRRSERSIRRSAASSTAQSTAWPRTYGPQTAKVVGPNGESIWTDKYGRVKVKFHWDRLAKGDDTSSCWVRVSSAWAGQGYGGVQIPREGDEVVVEVEGVGRLVNRIVSEETAK